MARSDWQTISGSTNNNSYFFTGIRWKYRDDLFGTSGYPTSRVSSNTDIIEYQPYVGKKVSSAVSNYYNSWLTSYYKYSYNTTSGSDPAAASNQLSISTTYRFDRASVNTTYPLTQGEKSTGNPMNTSSSTTSRIIQVPHCSDGTSKLRLYFYFAGNSNTGFHYAETNAIVTLEDIPRYTTISSFTVSKRNETSLTFNWSTADTIDYVYYSTNDGSNWRGVDVTDGKSGSFTVSQLSNNDNSLSPNTTYKCKLRVRRKDSQLTTDSSTVSQTTNAVPTISFVDKTETSITMKWTCDATADYIQYSTDNGSTWSSSISVNATSGNYTINKLSSNSSTNLSAGTTYNIKFSVRRKATGTWYNTASSSQTTYNYPYVSSLPSFTIGNNPTLNLYNPRGKSCVIYLIGNDNSTIYTGTRTGNGSVTLYPDATEQLAMYQSIPNSPSGSYKVRLVCSELSRDTTVNGSTYSVAGTEKPTLSSSGFLDTNSTTAALSAGSGHTTSSIIILNASTLQISVTIAAKKYASISTIKIEGSSRTVTSGGSGENKTGSATYSITRPTKSSFSVEATDSRGLPYSGTITIASANVKDYIPLTIVGVGRRNQPTDGKINISSSGKYYNASFGATNNTLTTTYRWKQEGGSYSNPISLNNTKGTGTHTEAQVQVSGFDYTKNFYFEFKAVDKLNTVTSTVLVTKGQPVFSWTSSDFNVNGRIRVKKNSLPERIQFSISASSSKTVTLANAGFVILFTARGSTGASHCTYIITGYGIGGTARYSWTLLEGNSSGHISISAGAENTRQITISNSSTGGYTCTFTFLLGNVDSIES